MPSGALLLARPNQTKSAAANHPLAHLQRHDDAIDQQHLPDPALDPPALC